MIFDDKSKKMLFIFTLYFTLLYFTLYSYIMLKNRESLTLKNASYKCPILCVETAIFIYVTPDEH